MVKPSFTGSITDTMSDSTEVRHAEAIVGELARGNRVAPEAVSVARDALVDRLWGGPQDVEGRVREGLTTLFERTPDSTDQAALLGDIVAAGPRD